ncbi:DHA2 family efflux MFS transporter permease subunit [Sphingosinicella sp. BN140058]|uniref:DHA2 family efflux MFS transporter permease subunit n=1 Tax=Sphingosinicella sp. BN140058 TaxID=1892855 RepID=UPI0010114A31|nr:DHA2 family efflux MFS transporter permease subunit [Sphingosinicella sp. BN140058]QAY76381.1 DHA2 family efflux MFS transporter permease subunit [Sphingosinicella sp. BN140058]
MASAAASASAVAAPERPALDRAEHVIVSIALMMAVLLQVLDTTIANVALPHMMASMSATQETINWVLTSYIVASAIAIPITGWLADRVGRRRLFIASVVTFTFASVLCAMAQNLPEMVAFRALQGVSGAFLVPIAQAVLFDINPPEKHARAMAMFGMGVMIGPILGPVLGGWLTDNFSWRWVFLVNLPVGILCTLILLRYMPSFPTNRRRFDLFGFALLALALGSLQMMLDRGEQLDWLQSWEIRIELGLAIAGAWMFVVHLMTAREPIFDPKMFADRTFAVSLLFMAVTGVLLLAGLALLPPLLQRLLGYSVLDSGFLTAPRGVGTLVSMMVAGRLTGKVDGRLLIFGGISAMALSLWQMSGFSLQMDAHPVIVSGFVQGIGLGLIFVPLQALAFSSLPPQYRTTAAALFNLARNIGGSIGISMVTFLLARNLQVSHSDLAAHVTPYTMQVADPTIAQMLGSFGDSVTAMLDAEINRQALMIAYLDDFHAMMLVTLCALPLVLLLRKPKAGAAGGPPVIAD